MGGHYRKPLMFSLNGLESAKSSRVALNQRVAKLIARANDEEKLGLTRENFATVLAGIDCETENLAKFREGLENDLATPVAMAAMQKEAAGKGTTKASVSLAAILKMDSVLSLDVIKNAFAVLEEQNAAASVNPHEGDPEAAEIDALVTERTQAKKDKNFARADEIRDILSKKGIVVTDTPNGPVWSRN